MIKLIPERFNRVLPLLSEVKHDTLLARAVLERKQGGRVFADNDMEPTVALVAHKCGLVFLFGFENNPNFNQYLPELL
ncbi:MAG TPA: hypothetical protein VHY08_25090, partial [Bacillota bacterium]|nr:hypothetical protein [Bacillota bacterium]